VILSIDLRSPTPVYRQIVDGLRILLVNGELPAGEQLPPVRRLALDLGVHFNTVAEAYRTLEAEGWLEIGRRNGARVVSRETPKQADPQVEANFQLRLKQMVAEMQARGFSHERIARPLRMLVEHLEGG
jgi:GntR family transcriptional regulator